MSFGDLQCGYTKRIYGSDSFGLEINCGCELWRLYIVTTGK